VNRNEVADVITRARDILSPTETATAPIQARG
jgi:hypothetical protein